MPPAGPASPRNAPAAQDASRRPQPSARRETPASPAVPQLPALPAAPPPGGGPWRWDDPRGRGPVLVPASPACLYDISPPNAAYQPCGKPGAHYPCGWRCPHHAPSTADSR